MKKINFSFLIFCFIFTCSLLITIINFSFNTLIIFISTAMGMLASLYAKDGKWVSFLFDIISCIFYIGICINEGFKGEAILSVFIIFTNFLCLKQWKKFTSKNFVKINKLQKNEIFFVCQAAFLFLISYSLFLYLINSNLIIINALCTMFFLLGNYFSFRRSVLQFYSLAAYEILYIVLWAVSYAGGSFASLILLLGGLSELICDVMAIRQWNKREIASYSCKCKACF